MFVNKYLNSFKMYIKYCIQCMYRAWTLYFGKKKKKKK